MVMLFSDEYAMHAALLGSSLSCMCHPSKQLNMLEKEQNNNNQAGEAAQSEQEPGSRHPYELKSLHLWLYRPVHYLADVQVMQLT